MTQSNTLRGKVAVVTGATKGIGLAITRMLAQEGCTLMLNARSEADLTALKQQIEQGFSVPVAVCVGSMGRFDTVQRLIDDTVSRFGRVDILINNAGVSPTYRLFQELSVDEIDDTIDVNLKGPMYAMKLALPHMVHQGEGVVININSIAGQNFYPYSAAYCASKHGLTAFTDIIAEEQRQNAIKVIGIYPGEVNTPLQTVLRPDAVDQFNRMLDPEDVAEAVRYALLQQRKSLVRDITIMPMSPP